MQHGPNRAASDNEHEGDEGRELAERDRKRAREPARAEDRRIRGTRAERGNARDQHQCDHHEKILDHQPAHGEASACGVHEPLIVQGA